MDNVAFRTAFRKAFPEFNDTSLYPDESLDFWGGIAETQVNPSRWHNMTERGIYLYTAHELVLASQSARAAAAGGMPGGMSGPMNTKTVGSVTAGYDTQLAGEKDAGHWNLTTYGKQFIRLARMFGAGVIQL